jgi:hypothetical protein
MESRPCLASCRRISCLSGSARTRPGPIWQPTGDPHRAPSRKHRDHDNIAAVGTCRRTCRRACSRHAGGRVLECGQVHGLQQGRRRDRRLVVSPASDRCLPRPIRSDGVVLFLLARTNLPFDIYASPRTLPLRSGSASRRRCQRPLGVAPARQSRDASDILQRFIGMLPNADRHMPDVVETNQRRGLMKPQPESPGAFELRGSESGENSPSAHASPFTAAVIFPNSATICASVPLLAPCAILTHMVAGARKPACSGSWQGLGVLAAWAVWILVAARRAVPCGANS